MLLKIQWLKHVAFLLILAVVSWWWMGLFSESTGVHLMNVAVVMALYCVNVYFASRLSFGWRLAGFAVLSVVFLFVVFWPVEKHLLPDALVIAFAYLLSSTVSDFLHPPQPGSRRTVWEAWKYLRNSRVREEEKAKAIIAEHLRTHSPGSR